MKLDVAERVSRADTRVVAAGDLIDCCDLRTARLNVPVCSMSCRFTVSVSWVSETSCTSFDVVYIVADVAGASWSLNAAWFDVWSVVVGQKVSAVADDVAMEWRRAGSVSGVWGLEWDVLDSLE